MGQAGREHKKKAEGRTKQKKKHAIKVNVTSKFNDKRKLSRMGKKVKAGTMGPNTDFITRTTVLKKLQVTLKDFRRLCILKGIYPRVPTKALQGADKIYYDIKDITYLSHEPLLEKFREFKTFLKKIRKAAGRNQVTEARRKDKLKPVMVLDHLVKERYPRFIDALRDLDDALCMIHLFAAMPSVGRITADKTASCQQLVRHWQYYVAKSKTLHKVFVSVKGIYFQAEVMGEPITWLQPHQFTQTIPKEVDVRVMMTFLEFYEVFIRFVLFKLYHSQGLVYPPKDDQQLKDAGCILLAIKATAIEKDGGTTEQEIVEKVNNNDDNNEKSEKKPKATKIEAEQAKRIKSLSKKLEELDAEDEEEEASISAPLTDAFTQFHGANMDDGIEEEDRKTFAQTGDDPRPTLFAKLKFFFNREVPLEWLQVSVLSFGGQIGWDGPMSPYTVDDLGITHHIIDRPMQGISAKGREYVQPQWVFDSINAQMLLPVNKYKAGIALPPHLSPFVNDSNEGYLPKYKEEIMALKGVSKSSNKEVLSDDEDDDEDEEEYEKGIKNEKKGKKVTYKDQQDDDDDDEDDDDEDEDDEDEDEEEEDPKIAHKGPKGVVHQPKLPKMTEVISLTSLNLLLMLETCSLY